MKLPMTGGLPVCMKQSNANNISSKPIASNNLDELASEESTIGQSTVT